MAAAVPKLLRGPSPFPEDVPYEANLGMPSAPLVLASPAGGDGAREVTQILLRMCCLRRR